MSISFATAAQAERIKDLADIEGVRANALIGYGIVVGLDGTGDDSTTSPFTINSITAMLERFGINVRPKITKIKPENIAAVMVTAELPAFARPGQKIDITVSSMGDASSLRGGTLLITPLLGGDGQAYAVAQGSISIGGFSVSGKASSSVKNHPTAGKVPNGARVEKAAPSGFFSAQEKVTIMLRDPDFTTVRRMKDVINKSMGKGIAKAVDAGTVEVWNVQGDAVDLIAQLEQLELRTDRPAIVVIDERTGTIVMGRDVTIETVAVSHGNISINVSESADVSQPYGFSEGTTVTTPTTDITVEEDPAKLVVLPRQVTLASLVSALNTVGASPSDLIAVLQAIKAAGALHAELKII
ncbi:flagellar basal body P-ring protein FlgI [Ghiorsea bivora]|uniref:flagellar basal body P-ring protein FlgI n=1 Tax=Ghiorsea bivora TaxID=1485545 RepID=UPI001E38821F|nr:flagellar basal body P-ring protein FlgI [Ghiorsea bivora]